MRAMVSILSRARNDKLPITLMANIRYQLQDLRLWHASAYGVDLIIVTCDSNAELPARTSMRLAVLGIMVNVTAPLTMSQEKSTLLMVTYGATSGTREDQKFRRHAIKASTWHGARQHREVGIVVVSGFACGLHAAGVKQSPRRMGVRQAAVGCSRKADLEIGRVPRGGVRVAGHFTSLRVLFP